MKTNSCTARFTALLITITAIFVTQTTRASALDSIVITENSDFSLTVVVNGTTLPISDINPTSADDWTVTLPITVTIGSGIAWVEPENLGGTSPIRPAGT